MNGASFSSYGMSQQKEEFLILGAGEEAEEGQFTEYPPLTLLRNLRAYPANSGLKC